MPRISKRKQHKPTQQNENAENLAHSGSRTRRTVKSVVADSNGNIIQRLNGKRRSVRKTRAPAAATETTHPGQNGNMVTGEEDRDDTTMRSTIEVRDHDVNMAEDQRNLNGCKKSTNYIESTNHPESTDQQESRDPQESMHHQESTDKTMAVVNEEKEHGSNMVENGTVHREVMEEEISDGISCDPGSDEDDSNNEDFHPSNPRGEDSDVNEEPFQEGCHFEIENGMFKCEFCGVLKATVIELKAHLRTHTGERPFLCLVCNKAFNAKRTLLYHQFSVHGIEHKSVAARYPDIRKRKLEAGELVDESVIQDLEKKCSKFEEENSLKLGRETVDGGLPFLVNGVVVENSKKRVCEICRKVCMKPSDLKRHMMSHTGERPFKCEVCGKQFRAKNSMMYHLKSAHGYMLELSPGLEERYQKLKKQNKVPTMSTGKSMPESNPQPTHPQGISPNLSTQGGSNPTVFPAGSVNHSLASTPVYSSFHASNGEALTDYDCEAPHRENHTPLDQSSGPPHQKDAFFESVNPKIFAPIPSLSVTQLIKPGGNPVGNYIHQVSNSGSCDMRVDSETVLVTRLDGTLSSSGRKVCTYKCYLCGKLFNYLSKIQFHLSFHFEREIKTYHCKHCSASFPFQHQIHRHIRKRHPSLFRNKELSTSTADSSTIYENCADPNSTTLLAEHFRVLRFKRKDSGSYSCMICKKSFYLESSLLKHIKMHSSHDFCYCKNCGQGFSDYEILRQHFEFEHRERVGCLASDSHSDLVEDDNLKEEGAIMSRTKEMVECEKAVQRLNEDDIEERKAKEILEKEGIGEVTVVLPCDPEDEQKIQENKSGMKDWQEDKEEKRQDLTNSSEIQAAPKMSLLGKVSGKSKRKASQPVRLNHLKENHLKEEKTEAREDPEPGNEVRLKFRPVSEVKVEEDLGDIESRMEPAECSPPRTSSPARSTASSAEVDYKFPGALPASGFWTPHMMSNAQFPHSLLATGQILQAMASSAHVPNPVSLAQALTNPAAAQAMLASGHMSSLAQAMAGVGHIPASLASTMTNASSKSMFMPPNLASAAAFMHPSFPLSSLYAMQAAVALQQSKLNNNVSTASVKTESNDNSKSDALNADREPDAPLDLATSSPQDDKNRHSPSASSAGNLSDSSIRLPDDSSPNTSTQGEPAEDYRDSLVGMPKVQWSPNDPASPFAWHHMTNDGRKVTSLSRTHSRLPIVHSPVNRDQICKPTTLDDGRQVFSCPFCSKNFSSYSDINRHMDFHEDIRPYKCKYCEYYARTNSQLKVHMMRHQGIREFCCKVCNYKGVTQSDLNRHMKSQIHMLKSRNECTFCGEGFVTAKNLEKHLDGNCIVKVQQEKGEYLF